MQKILNPNPPQADEILNLPMADKIPNSNYQNNIAQWDIVADGKKSGQDNMDIDLKLFKNFKNPTVRIYGWIKPCVSLGYSQNIKDEINLESAEKKGIEVMRRPTGGGIAFHTTDDVAYSVIAPINLFPKGLGPSYYYISNIILEALNKIGINAEITSNQVKSEILNVIARSPWRPKQSHCNDGIASSFISFTPRNDTINSNPPLADQIQNPKKSSLCFSTVMPHEITFEGKKLVGSAQKRGRHYLLQQGAISIKRPDESLYSVVKNKSEIENMINSSTFINDMDNQKYTFEIVSETLVETWHATSLRI